MKVRIAGIEISDISLDELDEIVKRYSHLAAQTPEGDGDGHVHASKAGGAPKTDLGGHANTTDQVILRKMVDAGLQGVPTADLGEMLGRRGKATRGAARKWAHRIGITAGPDSDPFDESRIGTQRALRIKPSLMDVAKAHLR